MHEGPIVPDRIRNTHRFDPEHPKQRPLVGGLLFVGLLAAGVLAMSYPIAVAVAIGFVAAAVRSVRWMFDRLRTANSSFPDWNEPKTVGERLEAVIPR